MTNINIYNNCPFDSEYVHLTHFTSHVQRDNFLNGYISWTATDFKVITNYVIVPFNRDYLDGCNYIDFTRGNFRQFAFVTSLEHINEVSTKITFEIDYWQTYLFNIDFGNAFVERGHGNYYNKNLLPDYYVNANIMLNEFKLYNSGGSNQIFVYLVWQNVNEYNASQSDLENLSVVWLPYGMGENGAYPSTYGGITGVDIDYLHKLLSCPNCKRAYVSHYATIGRAKVIFFDGGEDNFLSAWCGTSDTYGKINFDIPKVTNGSRWKKLNNYPYCYHKLKNSSGEIILENEWLPDTIEISIQQLSGISQTAIAKCENIENNGVTKYGKTLVDNKQNELSVSKDDLQAYLFNYGNSINNAMKMNSEQKNINTLNNVISGVQGVTSSITTGNPINTVNSVISPLKSELQNVQNTINFLSTEKAKQQDLVNSPDNIMGLSGGGSICACYENMNYFSIQAWGLDESNLQKMETYFDTYGYPIEKVVNVKGCFTSNNGYNYIKTNNLCVHVNNQTAKKIVNNAFNRGVWIYHNNADYSNFYNQGGGY